MQRISKLFRWTNLVVILLTFLSYLSPYINPEYFWPITFLGMAYPWLLLGNILFIFFWLFRKNRYFFFSFFCILTGWNHLGTFVGWNSSEEGSALKEDIHILSYNIKGGEDFHKQISQKHLGNDEFLKFIYSDRPNTYLCFQEVLQLPTGILEEKGFQYFYKLPYTGTAIFSKTPFLAKGGERFDRTSNAYVWVDVKVGDQIVRIFNIHLQSNRVSGVTDKVIQEGDLQEKETWRNIGTVIKKVKDATKSRSQQAKVLAQKIAESPHPVIICGDFNDTPQSYTYRIVGAGLKDTFKEKGNGFGTTYAGLIPALRIDYVFVDPQIKVLENSIPRVSFSDHYPVISRLELIDQ